MQKYEHFTQLSRTASGKASTNGALVAEMNRHRREMSATSRLFVVAGSNHVDYHNKELDRVEGGMTTYRPHNAPR